MSTPCTLPGDVKVEKVSDAAFAVTITKTLVAIDKWPGTTDETAFYHTDEARQIFDQLKEHFG